MNWKDTLEIIEPLVTERGYLEARAFVSSRKTHEKRFLLFKLVKETEFLIANTPLRGISIRAKHSPTDFIIVY